MEAGETTFRSIAQLALITRYSQERLPVEAFLLLLGLTGQQRLKMWNQLGRAVSTLVMFDGKRMRISHPLLAEEILRQYLRPMDRPEAWHANLSEFCIRFIEEMSVEGLRHSGEIRDILTDLFIERDVWQGSTNPRQFSALINELPSSQSERRVLEALCQRFPNDAHFWGHLGRHINLRSSGSFEEAEEKLSRAIELDPEDERHHHGLGMVYRVEVRRLLRSGLFGGETVLRRLEKVRPVFENAERSFAQARSLNADSQYPIVTPIQMILETFERLASLSRERDFGKFLSGEDAVAEWCRGKIATAEALLDRLHHQEANSEPTPRRRECDSLFQRVLGNFEGMVAGLSDLLQKPEVAKPPVRRMLANAYVKRIEDEDTAPQQRTLRRVVELMEENLSDDPANGHDVRTWFRAFRMLPDYTSVQAIERMTHWSLVSDDVDASYYLSILHFIGARQGIHKSVQDAKTYIEMCRHRAPLLLSKKSFEWWGAESLNRPCPLVHHTELGQWSKQRNFFEGVGKLGRIGGRIDEIHSSQAGTIIISGIPAFFVPRSDFRRQEETSRSLAGS